MKQLFRAFVTAFLLISTGWAVAAGKININTADVQALADLQGVGSSKAEAIVEYRRRNGPFASVDALTDVNGIGEKTLEANLDRVTVGEQ